MPQTRFPLTREFPMERSHSRSWSFLVLLAWATVCSGAEKPPVSVQRQVQVGERLFFLPADFEIELVAGPPLVSRPICADFDDEGRLYVGEAAGTSNRI